MNSKFYRALAVAAMDGAIATLVAQAVTYSTIQSYLGWKGILTIALAGAGKGVIRYIQDSNLNTGPITAAIATSTVGNPEAPPRI